MVYVHEDCAPIIRLAQMVIRMNTVRSWARRVRSALSTQEKMAITASSSGIASKIIRAALISLPVGCVLPCRIERLQQMFNKPQGIAFAPATAVADQVIHTGTQREALVVRKLQEADGAKH